MRLGPTVFFSALVLLFILLWVACGRQPVRATDSDWEAAHAVMIRQLREYGIRSPAVLAAMDKVRRHRFIPADYLGLANPYGDHPCPIGYGQTISQPYIVAYMTERIDPKPGEKILEIGTGSGYQAAILSELGADVYTIEIIPELAEHARKILGSEGYTNVHVLAGDGYKGWPEHAPFDAVIVTCAPGEVPQALVDQLKEGGRMILPLGVGFQRLVILRKKGGKTEIEEDLPVAFVPMIHGREK
ncbi:MAG: protein-L-isoaspartate(D-aspartate) O-methyltransferase [Verrucomicrobiota bacterium]